MRTPLMLDARPMAKLIQEQLFTNSRKELAWKLEVSDTWIRRVVTGEIKQVSLRQADEVLVKLDLPLSFIYPDEEADD